MVNSEKIIVVPDELSEEGASDLSNFMKTNHPTHRLLSLHN